MDSFTIYIWALDVVVDVDVVFCVRNLGFLSNLNSSDFKIPDIPPVSGVFIFLIEK